MKRTYRIAPDGKRPTDEEIARYRDHARLQANYNKALHRLHRRPLYKDPRAFVAILVLLLLVWLIMEFGQPREHDPQQDLRHQVAP